MSRLPESLASGDPALRDETPDDASFLERVFASLHAPALRAVGLQEEMIMMLLRQQYSMQRKQERDQFPDAARWVIAMRGAPVGRVCVDHVTDEHRLVEIVLLPEARGHGVGATVIRAIQETARAEGCDVTLHVQRDNPARRLYLRLGFEVASGDATSDFMRWSAASAR